MNIRKYLVKKLINKSILEDLIHNNDSVIEDIINNNFNYYMLRYLNNQHLNCKCYYDEK